MTQTYVHTSARPCPACLHRGGHVARAQAVVDHCPDGHAVDQAVLEAGGARRDLDVEKALDQVVRAGEAPELRLLQVAVEGSSVMFSWYY